MIKDKYLVTCSASGHFDDTPGTLDIWDLKNILDSFSKPKPGLLARSGFSYELKLFRINSFQFKSYRELNNFASLPRPSLQIVDEHQIGLAIQFPGKEYTLFTFDLIGDWDLDEGWLDLLVPDSVYPYGIM